MQFPARGAELGTVKGNPIKDEFSDLSVSRQWKYALRMMRDNRCRLCGEPAVKGPFCLKHLVAYRERARKKFGRKRRNDALSYRLEAKAIALARRKRSKKSK